MTLSAERDDGKVMLTRITKMVVIMLSLFIAVLTLESLGGLQLSMANGVGNRPSRFALSGRQVAQVDTTKHGLTSLGLRISPICRTSCLAFFVSLPICDAMSARSEQFCGQATSRATFFGCRIRDVSFNNARLTAVLEPIVFAAASPEFGEWLGLLAARTSLGCHATIIGTVNSNGVAYD